MRGQIPAEMQKLFAETGLDILHPEIEPIIRKQMDLVLRSDMYAGDPNLLLVRDLFIAGLAWRLLDNSAGLNSLGKISEAKLGAFLYLAYYLTKNDKSEFEASRNRAMQLSNTSEEKGTIANYVANKTHDAAHISDHFLSELLSEIQKRGNLPISNRKTGRLTVGFDRLAKLLGWSAAVIGLLIGLVAFNNDQSGSLGPAAVVAATLGFGVYGLVRGIAWVLKGFLIDQA